MSEDTSGRVLPAAQLEVTGNAVRCNRFGDVYRSVAGPIEEARSVFVDSSDLAGRFASCEGVFSVVELGFGTGLNFLLCWDCWRKNANANARLKYLAWERYPLDEKQWRQVHGEFPETADLAKRLGGLLPPRWPGWHNITVDKQVSLTLAYEDVSMMAANDLAVDAWFLDGFSPAKNPQMWSEEVMAAVGSKTVPGGTVVTYSAAGHVRSKLMDAGLDARKKVGFGDKKSMTVATKPGKKASSVSSPASIAVIGAGIAGASVAHELKRRGIEASIFDSGGTKPMGASSNPAAMLSARLTGSDTALSALAVQSFSNSLRSDFAVAAGRPCGLLSIGRQDREQARHEAVANNPPPGDLARVVDKIEAESIAGVPLGTGGLHVPEARLVEGASLTSHMLGDAEVIEEQVISMSRQDENKWLLYCAGGGSHEFDTVIVASGQGCEKLLQGRVAFERRDGIMHSAQATNQSGKLRVTLQYGGSLMPADNTGRHMLTGLDLVPESVLQWLEVASATEFWRGSRSMTKDRHPVAGSLGDGLYVLGGLASRGFTFAPLLANSLVSGMLHEPPVLPRRLECAVNPDSDRKHWQGASNTANS